MYGALTEKLAALAVLATLGTGSSVSSPPEHHVLQRSLEDRTWALETRSLLDDFSTCEGCQASANPQKRRINSLRSGRSAR